MRVQREVESRVRWLWVLVVVGVGLQGLTLFASDSGLDAHVRTNLEVGDDGASVLPWGGLRHVQGHSVNASPVAYDGWVAPWTSSTGTLKVASLASVVLLAGAMSFKFAGSKETGSFNPVWALPVLWSPVFLFSTGRGYDEAALALLVTGGVWWVWALGIERAPAPRIVHASLGASLGLVVLWKGLGLNVALFTFVLVMLASSAWHRWWALSGGCVRGRHLSPRLALVIFYLLSVALVSLAGGLIGPGSFSIIAQHPIRFVMALLAAALIGPGLYLLIGCLLWPVVFGCMDAGKTDPWPLYFASCSGVLLGAVGVYTAVLWTFEAQLWGASLASTIVLLGNNGRYVTVVIPLLVVMVRFCQSDSPSSMTAPSGRQWLALSLVLPFVVASSMVGHQLWSVDAGEALSNHISDGESFMLVEEPSLAMHHLYAMRSSLHAEGTTSVSGAWSSPSSLDSSWLTNATHAAILIGPNSDYRLNETQWRLAEQAEVPLSVPGIQTGSWRLYLPA